MADPVGRKWLYRQSTGELFHGGDAIAMGYSGFGAMKNDPSAQHVPNLGPIPEGVWRLGPLSTSEAHGPLAITLEPDPRTLLFGRSGFLCHGDSTEHPGGASHGCIIMERKVREEMIASTDKILLVVP